MGKAVDSMLEAIQRGWQEPGWINRMLYPLAGMYLGLAWIRRHAYRFGILKSYELPVTVIVVGNISAGGTGKTPLVMELTDRLKLRGNDAGSNRPGVWRQFGILAPRSQRRRTPPPKWEMNRS